jgi:uncharacterized membrane protein (UPF0127 family)
MIVTNETRGFTISDDAEMRDTFFGRFRGLMLSPRKDIILAVERESVMESTIHMMWMLYPIDVIWLNQGMTVVDVKAKVPPFHPLKPGSWRMHGPLKPAKYVIEISRGGARNTQQGDRIRFA